MYRTISFKRLSAVVLTAMATALILAVSPAAAEPVEDDAIFEEDGTLADGWISGRTSMSDLSEAELLRMLNLVPLTAQEKAAIPRWQAPESNEAMPRKWDWRHAGGNYVSPIDNQMQNPACAVFAGIAALESQAMIDLNLPNTNLDLAEQIIISCGLTMPLYNGHSNIIWGPEFFKQVGLPLETSYPYTGTPGSCQSYAGWERRTYGLKDYAWVPQTVEDIKMALWRHGPVLTTLIVYWDFFSYRGGIYRHTWGGNGGGHGIILVGYDDDRRCFIGKNSWGPNWGKKGFFLISYDEVYGDSDLGFDSVVLNKVIPPLDEPISLGDAVDTPRRQWQTDALVPWFGQDKSASAGGDSAMTCFTGVNKSALETRVTGPAWVRYRAKVNMWPDYDWHNMMRFLVDGEYRQGLSMYFYDKWYDLSILLDPGDHLLRWELDIQHLNVAYYQCAWLDQVRISPGDETVIPPYRWDGPWEGESGVRYDYAMGGAKSSKGHPVECRVRWGDGSKTDWGPCDSAGHVWNELGGYAIKVDARCVYHPKLLVSNYPYGMSITSGAAPSLGPAMEAGNLNWRVSGGQGWSVDKSTWKVGGSSVRSNPVPDDDTASLETTVIGPGCIGFYWRLSSQQDRDTLSFTVDGSTETTISGYRDWEYVSFCYSGGNHTLAWKYSKDFATGKGADAAWIDGIAFGGASEIASTPLPPSGPVESLPGTIEPFSAYGSSTSSGHAVSYRFDWGDGSLSAWTPTGMANHAFGFGVYQVKAKAACTADHAESGWSPPLEVCVPTCDADLGTAVDNKSWRWQTMGDSPWQTDAATYMEKYSSAASGAIGDGGLSIMGVRMDGPELLTFQWSVSSETGHDFLKFLVDGQVRFSISGDVPWRKEMTSIGPGSHVLEWVYAKDGAGSAGSDRGWVDAVIPAEYIALSFNIISPKAGVLWRRGRTKTIQWLSYYPQGPIDVSLLRRTTRRWRAQTIAAGVEENCISWKVPPGQLPGTYRIRIRPNYFPNAFVVSPSFNIR